MYVLAATFNVVRNHSFLCVIMKSIYSDELLFLLPYKGSIGTLKYDYNL